MMILPSKILFLDIDGVMNNATIDRDERWSSPWQGEKEQDPWFIPRAVVILQRLVSEGWYIVISSAWRNYMSLENAARWFGIPIETFLGITPRLRGIRGGEITAWLIDAFRDEKIEPNAYICILDDESDMELWQKPFFVQTEWRIPEDPEMAGLSWEHYQKIQRIIYKVENGYIRMKDLS